MLSKDTLMTITQLRHRHLPFSFSFCFLSVRVQDNPAIFLAGFGSVEFHCDVTKGEFISFESQCEVLYHFEIMRRELGILLILVISSSFVQAVDECPLQCDCTDDFSIVTCRDMEKFPVFDFASKVKIL